MHLHRSRDMLAVFRIWPKSPVVSGKFFCDFPFLLKSTLVFCFSQEKLCMDKTFKGLANANLLSFSLIGKKSKVTGGCCWIEIWPGLNRKIALKTAYLCLIVGACQNCQIKIAFLGMQSSICFVVNSLVVNNPTYPRIKILALWMPFMTKRSRLDATFCSEDMLEKAVFLISWNRADRQ